MKNILVINSGSTSVKYKLYSFVKKNNLKEIKGGYVQNVLNHNLALTQILDELIKEYAIDMVGHRVVHGGDEFSAPVLLNALIIKKLEKFNKLAPLHNPYNLMGIELVSKILPNTAQAAVFDTAFYAKMPEVNRFYAIDQDLAKENKIKRYGFHGISHKYVSLKAAEKLAKKVNKLNFISCHLGGGWSISAIKHGKPINTSMGWTPLEGLVMMTRSGDIDPGIVIELTRLRGAEGAYDVLNRQSGIKGLSGGIDDFLSLIEAMKKNNPKAKLAFDFAINRLTQYISRYFVELDGKVDGLIFTGSIGYGSDLLRKAVMKKIKCLGKIKFIPIKTDEELMIAKESAAML